MRKHIVLRRMLLPAMALAGAGAGLSRWAGAADHRDSTVLTANPARDIADIYSFRSPADPKNLVLVAEIPVALPGGGSPPGFRGTTSQFTD